MGWDARGTGCDRGASLGFLALRWSWGRRQHSPIRLGTNRKIFSSGILAAPLSSRPRTGGARSCPSLTSVVSPFSPGHRPLHLSPGPRSPGRSQLLEPAGRRGAGHPWAQLTRTWPSDGQELLPSPAAGPAAQAAPGSSSLLFCRGR